MIRKLKNILNNKENFNQNGFSSYDSSNIMAELMLKSCNSSIKNANNNSSSSQSPVNYIKKKIRSTKSWVKLPKNSRLFEEESAYESISSLEPANHEFETYTRASANLNSLNLNSNNFKSTSVDYGFESSNNSTSPSTSSKLTNSLDTKSNQIQMKHSTLNVNPNNSVNQKLIPNFIPYNIENKSKQNQENNLYRKLLDKLQKSSIDLPANIPLLCIESFNKNDQQWTKLNLRFISSGINIRLVEINKGVPINALFYLSDLDMIYVKTYNLDGDDLEGYVPRQCCKPINSKEFNRLGTLNHHYRSATESNIIIPSEFIISNNSNQNTANMLTSIVSSVVDPSKENKNKNDDSIKYHSLSTEMEYDNINSNQDSEEYTNLNENNLITQCESNNKTNENKNFTFNPIQLFNENKNSMIINERRHSLFSSTQRIQDCLTYELNNLDLIRNQLIKESNMLNNNNRATNFDNNNYSEISAINNNLNNNNSNDNNSESLTQNKISNNNNKKDLTHFSVTNYQLINDYEETSLIDKQEISPKSLLQSRSRLPISIRENFNIDEQTQQTQGSRLAHNNRSSFRAIGSTSIIGFNNFTYKSPLVVENKNKDSKNLLLTPKEKANKFEKKNARRSLDSSIANGYTDQRLYSVAIEIDEQNLNNNSSEKLNTNQEVNEMIKTEKSFSDLDLKNIELDSLKEDGSEEVNANGCSNNETNKQSNNSRNNSNQNKILTVILKHDAKNFQEISVLPGMMVMVIKEYGDWLYVKLIGYEKSNMELSQQYGMIPRNCVIDLQEIIFKSALNLNNLEINKRRKSQITAL